MKNFKGCLIILCHVLSWNKALSINGSTELIQLYRNQSKLSPSSGVAINSELHFAEGSAHNVNGLGVGEAVSSTEKPHLTNQTILQNEVYDLLKNGVPESTGSSGIKPRKGVYTKSPIVPRKGAPPCLESKEGVCPPLVTALTEETDKPVYELQYDINKTVTVASPLLASSSSSDNTKSNIKKPTVTVVPADSDELLQTLKKDRNVVIPVVALVCVPIIVLLLLLIYKRVQDARGNSHYTRMAYLIEDIYND